MGQDWDQMILEVRPNPNAIGKVYRQWASKIGAMLKFQSARKIKEGIEKGDYMIGIEGQMIRILPGMVEFTTRLPEGVVEKQFEGGTMYVDLNVTSNTRKLGMAREAIRRIQQMRKEMNLSYGDFVETYLMVGPAVRTILTDVTPIIRDATHSRDIKFCDKPTGDYIVEWTLFDEVITIGITPLHFDQVLKAFMSLPGINIKRARALFQAGFTTPESLHGATIEKMETISDIGRSAARKIRRFIDALEERGQKFSYVEDKAEDISEKIEEVSVQIKTEMEEGTAAALQPQEDAADADPGSRVAAAREESIEGDVPMEESIEPQDKMVAEMAEVPGVGPSKAQMLYDSGYVSVSKIAGANIDQLGTLPRIGKALARVIITWAKEEELKRGLTKKVVQAPKEEERLKTAQPAPVTPVMAQPEQPQEQPPQEGVHDEILSAVDDVMSQPEPPPPPDYVEPTPPFEVVQTVSSFQPGTIYLFEKSSEYDALIAFTSTLQLINSGLLMTALPSQTILRFLPPHVIAEIAGGYHSEGRPRVDFKLLYFSDKEESETNLRPSNIERLLASVDQYAAEPRDGIILIDGIDTIAKATSLSTLASMIAGIKVRIGIRCSLVLGVGRSAFDEKDLKQVENGCDVVVRR
jgi:ERCC4-type nuclease